jgi:hypothetical protein
MFEASEFGSESPRLEGPATTEGGLDTSEFPGLLLLLSDA